MVDFNQEQFHGGEDSKFKLKVKCNWKLAVENYCESYHLPWVHPDSKFLFKITRSLQYRKSRNLLWARDFAL